jgi:adenosine kinase
MNYKIAIVGPIPVDTITTFKGERITKYGCVTHPTIALAKLLKGIGKIIPIAHVHRKDAGPILDLLESYANIITDGVYSDKDQGTIIELNFIDQNNRLEKQIGNMSPITPNEVAPFLDADCFVFVPITDFEIEIETLKYIKANSNAKIIFDAHGPTTYVTEDGKRLRRYWDDKDEWLKYIDVLKMNLEESICSWVNQEYSDEELYNEDSTDHLDAFAEYVLDTNVSTLYVTLDSRGCAVYTKPDGEVKYQFVPSVAVKEVIDTTGCGDSFAGGLAYGFTAHNDPIKAAFYANTLGALRTQGKGFDVFKSLEETEDLIKKNY